MNVQRDPDAILTAWLHEGPTGSPMRRDGRSRYPPEPPVNRGFRLAAVEGSDLEWNDPIRPCGSGRRGRCRRGALFPQTRDRPSVAWAGRGRRCHRRRPSPSARRGAAALRRALSRHPRALTQAFTSPAFGYSIRYPAGWDADSDDAETDRHPGGVDTFGPLAGAGISALVCRGPGRSRGRCLDRPDPQQSTDAGCMPPRSTQETVTIDGHEAGPGLLRDPARAPRSRRRSSSTTGPTSSPCSITGAPNA